MTSRTSWGPWETWAGGRGDTYDETVNAAYGELHERSVPASSAAG